MTEPIKLPNMPFDLYHGIQDCDQYNAIRKYTTDAVEQNAAELRAEVERLRGALEDVTVYGDRQAVHIARNALKEPK
jgi:hypothetical protein